MYYEYVLTPTPTAWPLRGHTALKSILWEILFLDQLHDFSVLSLNLFLHSFFESKFMKKKSLTRKKIRFRRPSRFVYIYFGDRSPLSKITCYQYFNTEKPLQNKFSSEFRHFLRSRRGSNNSNHKMVLDFDLPWHKNPVERDNTSTFSDFLINL